MKITKQSQSSRRWTWVASAALLAVVVLVGVLVVITTSGETEQPRPNAQPPAQQQPSTPPQSDESSEAPQGDQSIPESAPQSQWELIQGVAVPTHPEAGPHQHRGGVAKDYQRSPVGALHAAWQIQTRYLISDTWREVVDQQVLDGPGKQAYIQARSQVTDDSLASEDTAQVAGFRFVTYTADTAVIQFAAKSPQGGLMGTTATVRWSEGDWKLELQPNGAASPTSQPLNDLTFYTPWSGV